MSMTFRLLDDVDRPVTDREVFDWLLAVADVADAP